MARAPSISYFNPGDCNTIDDRTGFKVKQSEVIEEWDGFFVTADNWEPRNPQDFPVVPRGQHVYENSRSQTPVIVYTPPDPLKDLSQ